MEVHLIVKNFGKIGSANILLNNLVVFVGNNNSGKTMIMQLIYGIEKELRNFSVPVSSAKRSDLNGQYLIRCDQKWFEELEFQVNTFLEDQKERILADIFGRSVSAEEIKISLEDTEASSFVCAVSDSPERDEDDRKAGYSIDIRYYENGKDTKSFKSRIADWDGSDDTVRKVLKIIWRFILSGETDVNSGQLFLPASRSGLQLLYRYYFAETAEGNLVMPVKDFLRFLQLYTENGRLSEGRADLLEFGEEHLLQGKIVQKGDETFYVEKQGNREIPLYISSSMIHELTPFVKALSATQRIDWIYCDEVENSLHPLMQGEMARWLIRMVNSGMHILISSHSDTMASRLNNLFMLTWLNREKAERSMLEELKLKEADLLSPDKKVSVYAFLDGETGKTVVEEKEFISCPMMGYDFQLFSKNIDKLYDEADRITR